MRSVEERGEYKKLNKDDNKSQEPGEKVDTTETVGVKDGKEKH